LDLLLSKWDVTRTFAKSVDEALKLSGSWDVILTDYHFGSGLNGLDLIERLEGRARVFALITADTSEDVVLRAAALGAVTRLADEG
jgi:CheY-like chemotaxis protein